MNKADTIEYRIGALELTPGFLPYDDTEANNLEVDDTPFHLFIVSVRGNIASLFVGSPRGHLALARMNSLNADNVKGGGFCYIDPGHRLTLAGFSGSFGAISKALAERFCDLLAPALKERSIPFEGTKAEPDERRINECWRAFTAQ
ncbi:MAG: hypothetical protein PHX93_01125 [Candidatus Peribacteraceae bacterium]|jgi:hypothetical protein|nr:hypothetical protein [Candidatus Peribacteraceae bacterium]